jgi:hypothetical protein
MYFAFMEQFPNLDRIKLLKELHYYYSKKSNVAVNSLDKSRAQKIAIAVNIMQRCFHTESSLHADMTFSVTPYYQNINIVDLNHSDRKLQIQIANSNLKNKPDMDFIYKAVEAGIIF